MASKSVCLLAILLLATSASAQKPKFDPRLVGTWVTIVPKNPGQSEFRIDANGHFQFYEEFREKSGKKDVTAYGGTVHTSPADAMTKSWYGKNEMVLNLTVSLAEAKRAGMVALPLDSYRKANLKEIPILRLIFLPDAPVLTDVMTTVLAPKGKERQAGERYAALVKKMRKKNGANHRKGRLAIRQRNEGTYLARLQQERPEGVSGRGSG